MWPFGRTISRCSCSGYICQLEEQNKNHSERILKLEKSKIDMLDIYRILGERPGVPEFLNAMLKDAVLVDKIVDAINRKQLRKGE